MTIARRNILKGLILAPAVVSASNLMAYKPTEIIKIREHNGKYWRLFKEYPITGNPSILGIRDRRCYIEADTTCHFSSSKEVHPTIQQIRYQLWEEIVL